MASDSNLYSSCRFVERACLSLAISISFSDFLVVATFFVSIGSAAALFGAVLPVGKLNSGLRFQLIGLVHSLLSLLLAVLVATATDSMTAGAGTGAVLFFGEVLGVGF